MPKEHDKAVRYVTEGITVTEIYKTKEETDKRFLELKDRYKIHAILIKNTERNTSI